MGANLVSARCDAIQQFRSVFSPTPQDEECRPGRARLEEIEQPRGELGARAVVVGEDERAPLGAQPPKMALGESPGGERQGVPQRGKAHAGQRWNEYADALASTYLRER